MTLSLLTGLLFVLEPAQAQERRVFEVEKANEKKNKQNRRNDRRGDRAKNNNRQKRAARAKMRYSQGDQAYQGDITGRKLRNRNRISYRPSYSNFAKPNPYAGKIRRSEASAAKVAARYGRTRPPSVTRRGERAYRTNLAGGKLRNRNKSSARYRIYDRPDPYAGKKRITESDIGRRSSKRRISGTRSISGQNQRVYDRPMTYSGIKRRTENDISKASFRLRRRPSTATRKGEVARNTTVDGRRLNRQRSVSRPESRFRPKISPYMGKKRRSEEDVSRTAARLRTRPSSITRRGERSTDRTVDGDLPIKSTTSVSGTRKEVVPRKDVYSGRKQVEEGERANVNRRKFSPPASITAQRQPPDKRKRIVPRTITSSFRVNRRRSPYGPSRRITAWERGNPNDITGRRFKKKDPSWLPPPRRLEFSPYANRPNMGDKPYANNRRINMAPPTASRPSEKGWKGSISGGRIDLRTTERPRYDNRKRINPYYGRPGVGDRPYKGRITGGYQSATVDGEGRLKRRPDIQGGRTLSITGQPRGRYKPGFDPSYGKRRPGDRPYSGRFQPNNNSISRGAEDGVRRRPIAGGRTLSISDQFKGPGRTAYNPYYGTKRRGDRPYSGSITPNRNSVTRGSEDAARRGRTAFSPYAGKRNVGDQPYSGRISPNNNSITRGAEDGVKRGRIAGGRTLSITDQFKGPGRRYYDPYYRKPRGGDIPYQGIIRPNKNSATRDPESGAGRRSYTGTSYYTVTPKYKGRTVKADPVRTTSTSWNNRGNPIPGRQLDKGALITGSYSGNIRARKPEKGGGTVTRDNWNNRGNPIPGRQLDKGALIVGSYSGNIRSRKPEKGGGTLTRDNWNNRGNPIPGKQIDRSALIVGSYSGSIKARRPETGGGSVSGTLWNNKGESITREDITPNIYDGARFRGRFKRSDLIPVTDVAYTGYSGFVKRKQLKPEMRDDHLNFSGNFKVSKRFEWNYHPSFYMHQTKEHDSIEQKDKIISLKMLWVRILPGNPARNRKKPPRLEFDEREQGLWYN